MTKMTEAEAERFESKFLRTRGCWKWKAAKDTDGYGVFHLRGRQAQAHVVAYEHYAGKIPAGKVLAQTCGERSCVRPDHHEPCTREERIRRTGIIPSHCREGHPYTARNTKRTKSRLRICLTCRRLNQQRLLEKGSYCKKGHELTADNVYLTGREVKGKSKKPTRRCRACTQEYQREYYREQHLSPPEASQKSPDWRRTPAADKRGNVLRPIPETEVL